jgi:4a-hydroxytetrahydrobiopterin dehydratase
MAKLTDEEVRSALEQLPAWGREEDEIVREFELPTFPEAIEFVVKVGDLAQAADHHPDLDIRYTKVRVALTSHDEGGLTSRDTGLAKKIDALASAEGS